MGFNSGFKGLNRIIGHLKLIFLSEKVSGAMNVNTRMPVKIILDNL